MGILDAPGVSQSKSRLSSLFSRLSNASSNPFAATTAAVDTPTITTGTAATVNGNIFGAQSGLVTEVGSRGSWNNTFGRYDVSGKGTPAGLDFYLTGTTIEFCVTATGTGSLPVWIWVNGVPVTAQPDTSFNIASSGADNFYKLVFPSSARRRVEIFFAGGASLNSWRPIRTDNATLVTPAPRRPVVGFVGDSFMAGSAAALELQSAAFIMSRLLGVECLNLSFGGTGYVTAGSFQTYGSSTRTALAAAAQPELLVFSGSVNDDSNSATVGAAATSAYAAYASACPKTKAIVFGPQPNSASATIAANRAAVNAALQTAALTAPNVLSYHDMIGTAAGVPAAWATGVTYNDGTLVTYKGSVWKAVTNGSTFINDTPGNSARWALQTYVFTGTGNTAAPAGDGTRDTYLYSDSVHPVPEGGAAMAIRQAGLIRDDLRRLAT